MARRHWRKIVLVAIIGLGLLMAPSARAEKPGNETAANNDPAKKVLDDILAQSGAGKKAKVPDPGVSVDTPSEQPPPPPTPATVDPIENKSADAKNGADGQGKSNPKTNTKPQAPGILRDLARNKQRPQPRDTAGIVAELLRDNQERDLRRRQDALVLYQQALEEEKAGRFFEAHRLAQAARAKFPDSAEINQKAQQLAARAKSARDQAPNPTRAKAHLLAGLIRGRDLIEAGRYNQGEEMLRAVVQGTLLFPEGAGVDIYRETAEQSLHQYRQGVQSGRIQPEEGSDAMPVPKLTAPGASTPANQRRVLQASEPAVPLWYAMQKNRLEYTLTVNYRQTPLALVLEDLHEATGIQFLVDEPVSLARAHLSPVVEFRAGEVSAETILNLACQKAAVEYVIMEKAVVITSPDRAVRYARQLPATVRDHWAATRLLFPELNPELLASPRAPAPGIQLPGVLDTDTPSYLTTGKALLEDIQALLRF